MNHNRDLLLSIKKIQKAGMQVSGGFIVGNQPCKLQAGMKQSGIVSAMVGLLNAPKNTRLYKQLAAENRLTTKATGNNTDSSMNFKPKMNHKELLEGYKSIINNIYVSKPYYKRLRKLLLNYNRYRKSNTKFSFSLIKALLKSIFVIGFLNKGRVEYWKLIIWTLFNRPKYIIEAITYTIYGYHFRTVYGLRN